MIDGRIRRAGGVGDVALPSVALLGILTAIDAMAIDAYIPALPRIQADFGISAALTQTTLSLFFIGVALGQAIWGPVSDRIGRRTPMGIGLLLFTAASVLASFAPTIDILLLARLLQAIGASAALVIARAVVSDRWSGAGATRIFSRLAQVLGVTSMVSPVVGAGILMVGGWRSIFAILAVLGIATLLWSRRALAETLQLGDRQGSWFRDIVTSYVALVRMPTVLCATVVSSLATGAMFAVLTACSFVFIDQNGWSVAQFSLLYAVTSVGFILICQANIALVGRVGQSRILTCALAGQLLLAIGLLLLVLQGSASAIVVAVFVILLISILGFILGNATAEAMAPVPSSLAGAASGFIGLMQFLLSAVVAPLATYGGNAVLAMTWTLIGCASCALLAHLMRPRAAVARLS